MKHIYIRMLGEFSLQTEDARISDEKKRSKKMWSLLAYLICNRKFPISQKKLLDLLYGDDDESVNPENALRITLHRLRAELDQLYAGAGKELILYKNGNYYWNSEIEVTLDCEEFEALVLSNNANSDVQLNQYLDAIQLYRGPFLPKLDSESWITPISIHFHNHFIDTILTTAAMLIEGGRYSEAVEICYIAVASEPYHEPLHQLLMKALGAKGDTKGAANVYETLSKRLFDDFGIRPSNETKEVYRAAAHSPEERVLPMDEILTDIKDPSQARKAFVCDYDYFKVLCYNESRSMERSGHVTHVALLSLVIPDTSTQSKKKADQLIDQLGDVVAMNLRRGDTVSRCSTTQYIVLLPNANYENSCMVCRRIIAKFYQTYPRVNNKINFMVQPLTPGAAMNF